MNNKLHELEKNLPETSCSFCTHLSFKGPSLDYRYDIRCVISDTKPDFRGCCEYFEPEYTELNTGDLDNLYINFLETCLKVNYNDYINSMYWKLFKERTLLENNFKCSICGSTEHVDVYHVNKNLGRETSKDVVVKCDKCNCK